VLLLCVPSSKSLRIQKCALRLPTEFRQFVPADEMMSTSGLADQTQKIVQPVHYKQKIDSTKPMDIPNKQRLNKTPNKQR